MTSSPVAPSPRVAPRTKRAVLVAQADRQAVELRLGRVLDCLDARAPRARAVEGAHFLLVEGVAERQHRHAVPHLGELRQRRAADALGRRIRRAQLGMLRLQRLQLAEQRVVLRVGDLRRVLHVVEPVVALDLSRSASILLRRRS